MNKIEKLVLLLAFWTSPWGAAKSETWEFFIKNKFPFNEEALFWVITRIINGVDDKAVDWRALEPFKFQTAKDLGLLEDSDGSNSSRIDVV